MSKNRRYILLSVLAVALAALGAWLAARQVDGMRVVAYPGVARIPAHSKG